MMETDNEVKTLYKFRSLQNLRRFLDILVNKRLFMAHYNEMNDPMEGAFLSDPDHSYLLKDVWDGKRKQLICCFSTDYKHTLLWSHYADSHQGCCLEVEVTTKLMQHKVVYSPNMPLITNSIDDILTHKSTYWDYENEVRYFKDEQAKKRKASPWLKVKIKGILLGYRMSKIDVRFYTSLIHSILGDDVKVRQITRNELDTGLKYQHLITQDASENNKNNQFT